MKKVIGYRLKVIEQLQLVALLLNPITYNLTPGFAGGKI